MTYTALGWLNAFDPFALHLTQDFGIRWYGLAYLLGFAMTYFFAQQLSKSPQAVLRGALVGDFIFAAALGTVIGGRLGYCVLYDQSLLVKFSAEFPFWGVLMLHKGGMASHGGILGVALSCVWFARKHALPALHLLDLTVTGGCIGIFFGRLANFVNGELVGRPCDPNLWWGMRFATDLQYLPKEAPEKLIDLSEAATHLGIPAEQWQHYIALPGSPLVYHLLDRMLSALQQGDAVLANLVAPVLVKRYPSQLVEALLEGLFLGLITLVVWKRKKRHGMVAGAFLILYPIVRIFGEQFRMPDSFIGFDWLGLTRGQWLSVGMVLVGLLCVLTWRRAPLAEEASQGT